MLGPAFVIQVVLDHFSSEMAVPNNLVGMTEQVNEVSFAGKGMKLNSAEDANDIVNAIREAKHLQALRLDGNTIGVAAANVIAEALAEKQEFERALWSDMFTGRVRSEIPPSLEALGDAIIKSGAKLKVLDLSDNAFGPDGVKAIKKLLMSSACYSLKVLKLNNNGLGIGGGKILSEALLECYKSSVAAKSPLSLEVFISGRNRLENDGAIALAKVFKTLGTFTQIQMPQNGIQFKGVTALADAFSANKNLKFINLNDNLCTEKGAMAIAKVLPELQQLEILNLGDSLLRDKGAMSIGSALKRGADNVKELIFSFNEIRIDGAMEIVKGVANKNKITCLNLDGNQLGDSLDEIRDKMETFGKADILAPFDENEEPDSDDQDGDDEEEEEEEQNNHDASKGTGDDLAFEIEALGLSKTNSKELIIKEGTVEDAKEFLQNPSIKLLHRLPQKQRKQLIQNGMKGEMSTNADKIGQTFVKVTVAIKDETNSLGAISDGILEDYFKSSEYRNEDIVNSILVHLGLLKSENKVAKLQDLSCPLQALLHVIQQSYFPRQLAIYFIIFLTKPCPLLDAHSGERHQLLQKLYQL